MKVGERWKNKTHPSIVKIVELSNYCDESVIYIYIDNPESLHALDRTTFINIFEKMYER